MGGHAEVPTHKLDPSLVEKLVVNWDNKKRKISKNDMYQIIHMYNAGYSNSKIAYQFGVTQQRIQQLIHYLKPVSYTHLTLPTICSV